MRILARLIIVCALGLTANVVAFAFPGEAKDNLHDPTLIPNCEAIGGDLIVMASDLTACCFEDGCWICDDAGDCDWDPAYSILTPPGGRRPTLAPLAPLKLAPVTPTVRPLAPSNGLLKQP